MTVDIRYLPKRVILSRKGFDTTKGGGSGRSLILGNRLFSMPIPQLPNEGNGPRYSDLKLTEADLPACWAVSNVGQNVK